MENKKLTAVQELISIYEEHKKNKGSLYGFTLTKKLQKKLLELEKEQIIEAHDSKFKVMDEKFEKGGLTVEYQSGLGYYNEKYGQK